MLATGLPDVAVIGAGPIGLAIAWRCAARGMRVTVYDPDPGSGASGVAAGMLAPVAETYFGERMLTGLLVESAARWPGFVAELTECTGLDVGYRTEGTLTVALTGDDLAEAERLWSYQRELGLPVTQLRPAELRAHEPLLAPRLRGGALAPGDHQVDPRRLVAALRVAVERAGVSLVDTPVHRLSDLARPGTPGMTGPIGATPGGSAGATPGRSAGAVAGGSAGTVAGPSVPAGPGAAGAAGVTVVAAGCGTAALTGLPIRPVKGQVLRLRAPGGAEPGFRRVIRGYADGRSVYLVPRADGEVVVGATVEERGDLGVTAGAVLELLRAATDLLPEIAEYELVQAQAGLRPGTPDNAPLIGPLAQRPDVVVAAGHYRHGIVLTPVTADLVADLLTTGVADPLLAPLAPDRFAPGHAPAGDGLPGGGGVPQASDRPVVDDQSFHVGRMRWS